jgi:hypothetical protein
MARLRPVLRAIAGASGALPARGHGCEGFMGRDVFLMKRDIVNLRSRAWCALGFTLGTADR